jgi:hypothetical protein
VNRFVTAGFFVVCAGWASQSAFAMDTVEVALRSAEPCIDLYELKGLMSQARDELAYQIVEPFIAKKGPLLYDYDAECQTALYRIMGLLSYRYEKDKRRSLFYYRNLLALKPDSELWDIGMIFPIVAQTYFDSLKGYWAPRIDPIVVGDSALWKNQWLPPLRMDVATQASTLGKRVTSSDKLAVLFHRARWLYARSSTHREFEDLYYMVHPETDPAFLLLKAEIRLRLGYSPKSALAETKAYKQQSDLLYASDLQRWHQRVKSRSQYLDRRGVKPTVSKSRIDSIGQIEFKVDRRYYR